MQGKRAVKCTGFANATMENNARQFAICGNQQLGFKIIFFTEKNEVQDKGIIKIIVIGFANDEMIACRDAILIRVNADGEFRFLKIASRFAEH